MSVSNITLARFKQESRVSQRRLGHVLGLDGIRGLAIALVLIHHLRDFILLSGSRMELICLKVLDIPWFGVTVFFVLSGFLITNILLESKKSPSYFRSFYARRALRIFPLYYGSLLFAFIVLPAIGLMAHRQFGAQLWFWCYASNWMNVGWLPTAWKVNDTFPGVGHFWSLAVEEQFYLVWPFLVRWTPKERLPLVCITGALASFAIRALLWGRTANYGDASKLTPCQVEFLMVGALAAWIYRDEHWAAWIQKYAKAALLATSFLCVCVALASRGFESWKILPETVGASAVSLFAAVTLVVIALGSRHFLARFFENKIFVWIGKYSYGIYILHRPIILWLVPIVAGASSQPLINRLSISLLASVVTIVSSCLLAYLSYQLFEKHFLKLKKYFQTPPLTTHRELKVTLRNLETERAR